MLKITGLLDPLQIRRALQRYAVTPNVILSDGRRGLTFVRFTTALTAIVSAELRLPVGEKISKADNEIIAQRGRMLLGLMFGGDVSQITPFRKSGLTGAQVYGLERWMCGREGSEVRRQFTGELQACLFFLDECVAEAKKYAEIGYALTIGEQFARFERQQQPPRDFVDFVALDKAIDAAEPRRLTDKGDACYMARHDTDGLDVTTFFGGE